MSFICYDSNYVIQRRSSQCQVNSNGNVVRSEILGAIKMKCYLSGMPELRLGLNDKVMFESTGRSVLLFSLYISYFVFTILIIVSP